MKDVTIGTYVNEVRRDIEYFSQYKTLLQNHVLFLYKTRDNDERLSLKKLNRILDELATVEAHILKLKDFIGEDLCSDCLTATY